jgi:hypothetical protein
MAKSFYFGYFLKLIYFFRGIPFRSVPSFEISSSAELEMPQNYHFLPRNNGYQSESIPRNFFGTNPFPTQR